MDGGNANGGRIVAFLVQDAIFLAGNVLDALGTPGPDQKDDPLLLALDVFGRGHPKIKVGLEAHKGIVLGAHVADNGHDPPAAPIPKGKYLKVSRSQNLHFVLGKIGELDLSLQGKDTVEFQHEVQVVHQSDGRLVRLKELAPQKFESKVHRVDVGGFGIFRIPSKLLGLVIGRLEGHQIELLLELQEGSPKEIGCFFGSQTPHAMNLFADCGSVRKGEIVHFFG